MPRKIEISHRTILFTVVLLIVMGVLFVIRDILLMIFVAFLISVIANPLVSKLSKRKIPRPLSTLILYIISIALIALTIAGITSPVIEQTSLLVAPVPDYLKQFGAVNDISHAVINELFTTIGRIPSQFARVAGAALSNIANVLFVLVLAFYMIVSRTSIEKGLKMYLGEKREKEIMRIIGILEKKLGGWVQAQVVLMLLVGLLTYTGLTILGIPHATALAFWAGIMEIIPYVGPILAAVPALIIALGISPISFLATLALYFLVQQIENYLFVPKVMQKSAGVNPIVTLIALAVGFKIAGIGGILLSVPVVIVLQVLAREYLLRE